MGPDGQTRQHCEVSDIYLSVAPKRWQRWISNCFLCSTVQALPSGVRIKPWLPFPLRNGLHSNNPVSIIHQQLRVRRLTVPCRAITKDVMARSGRRPMTVAVAAVSFIPSVVLGYHGVNRVLHHLVCYLNTLSTPGA